MPIMPLSLRGLSNSGLGLLRISELITAMGSRAVLRYGGVEMEGKRG